MSINFDRVQWWHFSHRRVLKKKLLFLSATAAAIESLDLDESLVAAKREG